MCPLAILEVVKVIFENTDVIGIKKSLIYTIPISVESVSCVVVNNTSYI